MVAACGDEVQQDTGASGSGGAGTSDGSTSSSSSSSSSAAGGSGSGGGSTMKPSDCLSEHHFPVPPDYDPFEPVMGSHCKGTNHQDIAGVQKLVILGDSISQGTPPTPSNQFYRNVLADKLSAKFPDLVVEECAENGARMSDLAGQIDACFPGVEPLTTLVVMTMGGNDAVNWATNDLSQEEAEADAEVIAGELRDAVATLQDPAKFPAGSYFIFTNVYEYTDGTADLDSCPTAGLAGLSGTYYAGATALAKLQELYMEVAVDTQTDMVLMGEEFCGHGYNRDETNTCYVGPDAENWFDLTCIHPTPTGHGVIADLFELVVDE
jgi:lysophospholipase L1-like esterase